MPIPTNLLAAIGFPIATDITVYQGDSFYFERQVAVDQLGVVFTGAPTVTAAARIRNAALTTDLLTLTAVVVDPATGIIRVTATPVQTAGLTLPTSTAISEFIGYWDVQVTDGTNTVTVAAGKVTLVRQITP
jgi:hypothetical protein